MKNLFITGFLLASVAFIVFMAIEAPRGQILATRTAPSMHVLADRFGHYHYTGHAVCDLGKMVGLCGDVGSLTKRGSGGF